MTIGLAAIVRDEEPVIGRCLQSVLPLIDHWTILDTGSTDRTPALIRGTLRGVPGELIDHDWAGYSAARNAALKAAQEHTDWVLTLDADMVVESHPDLKNWLADDPDPDVGAWQVLLEECGTQWRLPLLTRGGLEWRYVGAVHEYLHPAGRKQRPLLGLTVHHLQDSREGKELEQIQLLRDGVAEGDPRAVFYTAQALRFLGRTGEAIELYDLRAGMGGFEEEAWYAQLMAARLRGSVEDLLAVHARRPWRAEALRSAAALIPYPSDDLLFVEAAA